jgi:hypothetical protein
MYGFGAGREWPDAAHLRHSKFVALREDNDPEAWSRKSLTKREGPELAGPLRSPEESFKLESNNYRMVSAIMGHKRYSASW